MVVGSTCSLVWERRTTCWVTMRVPDPNIPIVRRPLPVREGRDLDHHVTACSEGAGVRGHAGGGGGAVLGLLSAPFLLGGGGGGSKRPAPLFPGPQGGPAHGLHPRFVVAEIWADKGGGHGRWYFCLRGFDGDKIRSGCLTLAFSGAHKWARMPRNPDVLGTPTKRTKSELAACHLPLHSRLLVCYGKKMEKTPSRPLLLLLEIEDPFVSTGN